jgi:DNA invertase Pin-like site-specific DNA recombinase
MSEKKRVAVYRRYKEPIDDTSYYTMWYEYYKPFIEKHENWQLTELYADEGSVKNQTEFKRLINDCRAGNIDMIIARSVSKFGRNLVEAIETAQYLSRLKPPVGVFFEQENLDSLDKDSTIMLSLFLLMGLEERRLRSEIQKRARQKKIEKLGERDADND